MVRVVAHADFVRRRVTPSSEMRMSTCMGVRKSNADITEITLGIALKIVNERHNPLLTIVTFIRLAILHCKQRTW